MPTESDWNAFIDITVWTAWTPATKETGCMRFVRGSHRDWYFDERQPTSGVVGLDNLALSEFAVAVTVGRVCDGAQNERKYSEVL